MNTNDNAPQGQAPKDSKEFKPAETFEEKFFAGKFKSIEDLEKGYKEVEKAKTKAEQEKAEYLKALQEVAPYIQQGQAQTEKSHEDKLYEDYTVDPVKTTRGLISEQIKRELNPVFGQLATVVAATRLDAARNDKTMPEFSEWQNDIQEELNTVPEIYARPDALKIGYRLVKEKKLAKEREKEQASVEGSGKINREVIDLKGMSSDDIRKRYASIIPTVET